MVLYFSFLPQTNTESAGPVMAWVIMRWAFAQLLSSVGSRTHPAQWWIPLVLVSCDTSSSPDPQWATFSQRSVNDPLLDSVWRAQEKLCCGWRHKNGETCPPPAMLSLFDGTGMSRPRITLNFPHFQVWQCSSFAVPLWHADSWVLCSWHQMKESFQEIPSSNDRNKWFAVWRTWTSHFYCQGGMCLEMFLIFPFYFSISFHFL